MSSIGKAINKVVSDEMTGKTADREQKRELLADYIQKSRARTGVYVIAQLAAAKEKHDEIKTKGASKEFDAAVNACYAFFLPKKR
jgi:hypothetical protein